MVHIIIQRARVTTVALMVVVVVASCQNHATPHVRKVQSFCPQGQTVTTEAVKRAVLKTQNSSFNQSYFFEPKLRAHAKRVYGFEASLEAYRMTLPFMARAIGYKDDAIPIDRAIVMDPDIGKGREIYLRAILPSSYKTATHAWYLFTSSYTGTLCSAN